jgi:hypothetical protein
MGGGGAGACGAALLIRGDVYLAGVAGVDVPHKPAASDCNPCCAAPGRALICTRWFRVARGMSHALRGCARCIQAAPGAHAHCRACTRDDVCRMREPMQGVATSRCRCG